MSLTPGVERETGQVIIEGLPGGVAGEASLIPVPGLELAFDRADGRLCRVVVDTAGTGGSVVVGEQAAAMLVRLLGAEALGVVSGAAAESGREHALSPDPELSGTLSRLARLDAARATSPVPPGSPWWAAEAAGLAERAGLPARAVAAIAAADEPAVAARLREAIGGPAGPWPGTPAASSSVPAFDVAAEVEILEKDPGRLTGLQWLLDPALVPEGLFRTGLSPCSDLPVRHEGATGAAGADGAEGMVVVEAVLVPGADCDALSRCRARLVDPDVRRVLAQAAFTRTAPDRVRAELPFPFPLDELPESWIEVVQDKLWPVRSRTGHRIRRALRWADAALRAERTPAGLAPQATHEDWAALAAAAWERCRRDWEAAGDDDRAGQAACRQAAWRRAVPPPAADGPAYLAEVLGR